MAPEDRIGALRPREEYRLKHSDIFAEKRSERRATEQPMSIMDNIGPVVIAAGLIVCLSFMPPAERALAFEFEDAAAIGAAYATHLFLHEMGHQVVAEEVGADSPRMSFFTRKGGTFYPGLSTHKSIPQESKLSYAAGGERMAGFTFEYGLQSYQRKPTTYNKALMFFSCTDFLVYTLMANYASPKSNTYDPNLIREKTGLSKDVLLSLVIAKSLLNAYRVINPDAKVVPMIWLDEESAALLLHIPF